MLFSKGAFVAGVWQQPADQGLRDETIARLIDPKTPPGVPNYAPFAGDLLAIPREQLQDRLYPREQLQDRLRLYNYTIQLAGSRAFASRSASTHLPCAACR